MLIVFFGTVIMMFNSIVKINTAVFEGKVKLKYVLKHFGIMMLTFILAALVLILAAKFLPASLRF